MAIIQSAYSNEVSGTPGATGFELEADTWYSSDESSAAYDADFAPAELPFAANFVGCEVGGKAWLLGRDAGAAALRFLVYDPSTNTYDDSRSPFIANGSVLGGMTAIGTKIYVGGHWNAATSTLVYDSLWVYDTANEGAGWTQLTSLTGARRIPNLTAFDGYLFAAGTPSSTGTLTDDVYRYDPGGDSWSHVSDLGQFYNRHRVVASANNLWLPTGQISDTGFAFLPRSNNGSGATWPTTSTSGLTGRGLHGCWRTATRLIVAGGSTTINGQAFADIVTSTQGLATGSAWSTHAAMPERRYGSVVACVVLDGICFWFGGTRATAGGNAVTSHVLAYVPPEGAVRPY